MIVPPIVNNPCKHMLSLIVEPEYLFLQSKRDAFTSFLKELYYILPDNSCLLLKLVAKLDKSTKWDKGHSAVVSKEKNSLLYLDPFFSKEPSVILQEDKNHNITYPDDTSTSPTYVGYLVVTDIDPNSINNDTSTIDINQLR